MSDPVLTADDYLNSIGDWQDPLPDPVVVEHDGIQVVRDDLLHHGTKLRSLDYIIGHDPAHKEIQQWCFGCCPYQGYAQISLPIVCKRHGKEGHIFMAKRKMENRHEYQLRGEELGTIYHWVPDGMLNVTKARAREYAELDPEHRKVLPLGLEHETVIGSLIRVARNIDVQPDHVWSVGASGTLNRALQFAWPEAEVHVVQVGHKMKEREIGRAIFHKSPYTFNQKPRKEDVPPYPSVPEYDAKLWSVVRDYYKTHPKPKTVLCWNVA